MGPAAMISVGGRVLPAGSIAVGSVDDGAGAVVAPLCITVVASGTMPSQVGSFAARKAFAKASPV